MSLRTKVSTTMKNFWRRTKITIGLKGRKATMDGSCKKTVGHTISEMGLGRKTNKTNISEEPPN